MKGEVRSDALCEPRRVSERLAREMVFALGDRSLTLRGSDGVSSALVLRTFLPSSFPVLRVNYLFAMSLVYLFRRLVFIQVMLGIVAFCMAEPGGNPGLMIIAGTVCALSWYVVEGPTGKPIPQWGVNLAALAAVLWLGVDMYIQKGHVIIAMGHFTMWLQILQLYGKKSNREYGLILVLSLLQMVGASILSVSMIFGLLLAGYCVLSLFTVLLFQFKSTSDEITEANAAAAPPHHPTHRPSPVVSRGHRWQFRLIAIFIALVCGGSALVLFVLIPRTSRFNTLDLPSLLARTQTGFTSRVQLGGMPPGEGSREPVLNVQALNRHGSFLMRGAVLDRYSGRSNTWLRGSDIKTFDRIAALPQSISLTAQAPVDSEEAIITLRGNRHNTIFTIYPTALIELPRTEQDEARLNFNFTDQQITLEGASGSVLEYRTLFLPHHEKRLPFDTPPPFHMLERSVPLREFEDGEVREYARGWRVERELIRNYCLQVLRKHFKDETIDRDYATAHDPRDYEFAKVLENHLQTSFAYSLTNRPSGVRDPIVDFLTTDRQGHCELFASALAAMVRSLGMPARVVTGFRVSEYNSIGGYYIVRERNAHAWTEIDCGNKGWQVFDGTPPAEIQRRQDAGSSIFSGLRNLYEHLEYLWLDSFVSYDRESRAKTLDSISSAAQNPNTTIGRIVQWFSDLPDLWRFNQFSFLLMVTIFVFIVIGFASLTRTVMIRRKRLAALQLTRLPRAQRRTLARRLSFYLQMLDMLERHGQVRPVWQSPFKFATDLQLVHAARYRPVVSLTEAFYEIRFGHRDMDDNRRQSIRTQLKLLEQNILGRDEQQAGKAKA